MQRQDYDEQMTSIERKRLDGKMSYEEAILARQRLADENRQIADELKRQTHDALERHVQEKLRDEQRMKFVCSTVERRSRISFDRQLIDEVVNGRENAKASQQKLQAYKADFVKQYKEELKQMTKQALEEVRRNSLYRTGRLTLSLSR